jgi:hypothetical protein
LCRTPSKGEAKKAAGGGSDMVGRTVTERWGRVLKQSFVVDNIGGGERLSSKRTAAGGEVSSPLPQERMQSKRKDVESTKHDDSAPFGLHEHLEQQPNPDPGNSQAPSGKQR